MTEIHEHRRRQVCMTCYENNRQFSLTTQTRNKKHITDLGEKFSGIQILTFSAPQSLIFTSSHTTFVNNVCTLCVLYVEGKKMIINKIISERKKKNETSCDHYCIIMVGHYYMYTLTTTNCCCCNSSLLFLSPVQNIIMVENFLMKKNKKIKKRNQKNNISHLSLR